MKSFYIKYDLYIQVDVNELNNSKAQLKLDKIPELMPIEKSVNSNNGKLKRNKFPCLITENCEYVGCLQGIIEHFEKIHPLEFQQV